MRKVLLLFVLSLAAVAVGSAGGRDGVPKEKYREGKTYIFRLTLRDKVGSAYSLDRPSHFLSHRSIERRIRQSIALDSTDLPVSHVYLRQLEVNGVAVVGVSKWNNSVLLRTGDTSLVKRLADAKSFVTKCERVWVSPDSVYRYVGRSKYNDKFNAWDSVKSTPYGAADEQVRLMAGQKLHQRGFLGEGMTIAVLDGGFMNVDRIPAFSHVKIEGEHDFVCPPSPTVYKESDHGTKVLSAMALRIPYIYIGTAPDARYWLLRCEDRQTEQPVEEDYWAMAAEFADSVGVDIINSSLGYNEFDNHADDHRYREMDGHTTLISRSASLLARKGIVLVNSAGNNGMGPWKKIAFPADADDILAVGAIDNDRRNASFTGVGPTKDGRVKPDVMALGSAAAVVTGRGTLMHDIGTSFASPAVCGLVACLWQAMPWCTASQIMDYVRRSGDNYDCPDNIYGYGVPNFWNAYTLGRMERQQAMGNTQ